MIPVKLPYTRYLPLLGVLLLVVAAFALVLLHGGSGAASPAMGVLPFLLLALLLGVSTAAVFFFIDARRLRHGQASLQEQKLLAEAVLDAAPCAYLILDGQNHVLAQRGVARVLGTEKIATLYDVSALLQPAGAERLQHCVRDLNDKGEEFTLQLALKNAARAVSAHGARHGLRGQPPSTIIWLGDISRFADEVRQQAEAFHRVNHQLAEVRSLLAQLPCAVWMRARGNDGVLKITWCNNAYAHAVGASVDAVVAGQIELVPAAQRGKEKSPAQKALETGQPQCEQRHVVIGGQRHLLAITENITGPDKAIIGMARDITREAELDAELKRHIRAHEEVLEHLGAPIAIYGADTRLKFYNRSYLKLWGADENFLRTEPTFSEILEDLRTRRRAPEQSDFQKYKRERTSLFTSLLEPREDLMHLPDGTTLRIMAVPHPFGGIMFVHEDVTDKLALESSYNTLIAVQRETLDNLAEGLAVYGSDGRLKLYNPAFIRIWKLDEAGLAEHPHIADMLEMKRPLLNTGNDWQAFKREAVAERLDRTTHAGRYERVDGSVVEYSCVPLPDGAVLTSYLDVTDSIRVEKALREANVALAAADRLKSEFVANVSYQLRTPLNTIMGYAEILANGYFGTLNDRQQEYAQTMMDASKKLLHLINDVLDLATIEAGRMALNRKALSAKALLRGAVDMTAEWARQQAVTLEVVAADEGLTFEADELRMKQVLFNLISNAIQYTPKGGSIRLSAAREGEWMALTVEDSGVGIPVEDQTRIFEKFERANPDSQQSGAGLGLSLVKSFIELHGGRIVIDSRVGEGTRITCLVPLKTPEQKMPFIPII